MQQQWKREDSTFDLSAEPIVSEATVRDNDNHRRLSIDTTASDVWLFSTTPHSPTPSDASPSLLGTETERLEARLRALCLESRSSLAPGGGAECMLGAATELLEANFSALCLDSAQSSAPEGGAGIGPRDDEGDELEYVFVRS